MSSEVANSKKFVPERPINAANAREMQKRGVAARLANIERAARENSEPHLRALAKRRLLFLIAGVKGSRNALQLAEAYSLLDEAERDQNKPKKEKKERASAPAEITPEDAGDPTPAG